jgi:hypothetical protein
MADTHHAHLVLFNNNEMATETSRLTIISVELAPEIEQNA